MLPSVIHPDQCAYIKDRYLGESVRILADVMHHTKEINSPGILLFCDFEKAFATNSYSRMAVIQLNAECSVQIQTCLLNNHKMYTYVCFLLVLCYLN